MSQRYLGGIITANPTAPTMASASGVWTLEQQFQYSQSIQPEIIGKSVRIRGSAAAYLTRTPASSGNLKTYTYSVWVKRGTIASGTNQSLLAACTGASSDAYIGFTNDVAYIGSYQGAGTDYGAKTAAVFRDPSAWYHIVFSVDTTQATAANRAIIYVNGVAQTTTTSSNGYWPQNYTTLFNTATAHRIGQRPNYNDNQFDGYIAEAYFIDGQALAPSSFGAFDSNGVWQPIVYTGTYGTNGFYIDFSDNSAATATTLGKDYSGNGNNWTPTNISVTAGTTYDSMIDSPTNFDNGGTGVGNYAVLNPVVEVGPTTRSITNGNLSISSSYSSGVANYATTFVPLTGKWYWEVTVGTVDTPNNAPLLGVMAADQPGGTSYNVTTGACFYRPNGQKQTVSGATTYGATWTTGDIIGVAVDMDGGTVTFYKNNASQGTALSGNTTQGKPAIVSSASTTTASFNFGQQPFTYTPPTGFKALNTQNLALAAPPTITNGAKYMAATLYTGTGATQTVTNGANTTIGTTFQPDLVWTKNRGVVTNHSLVDSVRGVSLQLSSNQSIAEVTDTTQITGITSTGFSMGNSSGGGISVNTNANTYVGWQWQAGRGTTSSNTNGTITSTVSVGATQGFSVVTYTGNGITSATVGHGLGVTPAMVIVKTRSLTYDWFVRHQSLPTGYQLRLQSTAAQEQVSSATTSGGLGTPTSTVFNFIAGSSNTANVNSNGATYVAYCFASVAGYSAFGSYTGNGAADGPFIYTGFRPRFVMMKASSAAGDWIMLDTSRDPENVMDARLQANASDAESTTTFIDSVSNGFKVRSTNANVNASSVTIIYAAFAENPFTIARAR